MVMLLVKLLNILKKKWKSCNILSKKVNIYYAGFTHRGGGAYHHTLNLSKGLTELGYEVKIITLDALPLILRYFPHLVQKIGNILKFPLGYLYKQKVIKYYYKFFFKNTSDIDIFEDIYTYWKSDTKSIVVLHALWSDNLQAYNVNSKQRILLEINECKVMNKIESNVITVSIPYKDFLLARLNPLGLNKEINVVKLGIDISCFSSYDNNNKSIIFVGSLEERKNIKFLLKVFMRLQLSGSYTLTLVGDGPQKKELISYINRHNIENVTFLGRLNYEEVIHELTKHQYYMHTSIKESFSYSLLEAKLSGLTTIAYSGLEVPNEFIDIKVEKFKVAIWFEKIDNYNRVETNFDKNKFSYQIMTKNTLERIK